ncbi:hypothetical protein SmJEL517_g02954 [Synchytrium microbalum]|uniref:Uncharacterized protein n=1 Tax=Synchytrium microbalum TaxID=1806994 RepID=A0A507C5L7_9FUNG|nr:uncharacterized protein SmJEL517_g02954 [Synchytrium microbalum]TPX34389.1 hypothetical protein SmJEL517_g02954 [Synchytrium microbalum]
MAHWLRKAAVALLAASSTTIFPNQIDEDTSGHWPFEVTAPIAKPNTPSCSILLAQTSFGNTYGRPFVASYTPQCGGDPQAWSLIVLKYEASGTGRQFDRTSGVWLGGVELLRTTTAEPSPNFTVSWTIEKDVTRFASVFALKNAKLVVALDNIVNDIYTAVLHVNVTATFYATDTQNPPAIVPSLVIPVSASEKSYGWWSMRGEEVSYRLPLVPRNVVKASLEVFISAHGCDEFWYTNIPSSDPECGNGTFKELMVSLDEKLVSVAWPTVTIYTGGINPLLWRPIFSIQASDVPSIVLDLTPYIYILTNNDRHTIGLSIFNANSYWLASGSLQLWTDSSIEVSKGGIIENDIPAPVFIHTFNNITNESKTIAHRNISYSGFLFGSQGLVKTIVRSKLDFDNVVKVKSGFDNVVKDKSGPKVGSSGQQRVLGVNRVSRAEVDDQTVSQSQSIETVVETIGIKKSVESLQRENLLELHVVQTSFEDKSFAIESEIFQSVNLEKLSPNTLISVNTKQQSDGDFFRNATTQKGGGQTTTSQIYDKITDVKGAPRRCYTRSVTATNGSITFDESDNTFKSYSVSENMVVSQVEICHNGPKLSQFVYGTWRLADNGATRDPHLILQRIQKCVELGITSFDLADIYGMYTYEKVFGQALALAGPEFRQRIQLITKCDIVAKSDAFPHVSVKHYDTSFEYIVAAATRSLHELGVSYLDVLLLHRPDVLMDADEVARAFHELKLQGKVLHFGVSNFNRDQFELLQSRLDFPLVTNQIEVSCVEMKHLHDGTLDFMQKIRTCPMVWSPLCGGAIFKSDQPEKIARITEALKSVAAEIGPEATISDVAFAWILTLPSKPIIVLGTNDLARLEQASKVNYKLSRSQFFTIWQASAGRRVL